MQSLYASYTTTSFKKGKKGVKARFKDDDFLERPEKRSPYDNPDEIGENEERNPGTGVLYVLLTLFCLLVLYPVGLLMLWARKIRLNGFSKLMISVITAVAFCIVVLLGVNFKTNNPRIKQVQNTVRGGLEWVSGTAGDMMDGVVAWGEEKVSSVTQNAARIWDALDESVARKGLALYERVDGNIEAVKKRLPRVLINKFSALNGYDIAPASGPVYTQNDMGISVTNKAQPTATVAYTAAPTPSPTPTATPEPTLAPVTLPAIKDVALAPVYFTAGGTYYHATANCSGMMNAVSHTLAEAQAAGKKVCENCGVVSFSLMDTGEYLWIDQRNVAHTSIDCLDFNGQRYAVLPFEDVYEGSFTYCATCGGSTCFEYMRQNDKRYNVSYTNLDGSTIELYNYEKTITVYYSESSRSYHANPDCQHMRDEKYKHTLYQALHIDNKKRCELCAPLTEEQALNAMQK